MLLSLRSFLMNIIAIFEIIAEILRVISTGKLKVVSFTCNRMSERSVSAMKRQIKFERKKN